MNPQPSKVMGQPSVIARLMGIDAIPMPIKATELETNNNQKSPPAATATSIIGTQIKVFSSPPFNKQPKCSLLSYRNRAGDSRRCLKKMRVLGRPRSRQRHHHHPQEHLLQKIKDDFQSWQASTVAALGNNTSSKGLDGRCIQMIAQENLRKEKMARYGYRNNEGVVRPRVVVGTDQAKTEETKIITVLRAVNHYTDENLGDSEDGHDRITSEKLHSPAQQIVLLKPSFDMDGEPFFGLSKVDRDDGMKEFLQEVKERLQKELKVKRTTDLKTVNWRTQIKLANTTDLGKRLSRSEAFRAFRNDPKRNHGANTSTTTGAKQASPEHVVIKIIKTRNVLAHKARSDTVSPKKEDEESVDSSSSIRSRARVRSLTDVGFGEQTFTSSGECVMENSNDIISPQRKLVRSFSAPESRSRLFLDESVGSRNHGASDITSENGAVTSRSSSSFSFRETVSSLRHRFSFRGKLFGRKKKPSFEDLYPQLAIGTSPSPSESFRLYNFPQASFAELPPSPVSPLEIVGQSSRHLFNDLNCSLPDLSRNCPSEFEAPASELSFRTDVTVETMCNQDKAYLREVLIAAGLYDDGSLENKANARVDSMARPICDYVFEEVEDVYYYRDKSGDGGDRDIDPYYNNSERSSTDHRMLFDLANEALQNLVQNAKRKTGSSLGQWVIDSTGVSRGRKLVDDVWQQVQALRYPQMQEMQTIDSMVAFEVRKSVWAEVLVEDVYVVGRKIERAIFDELIDDLLLEVYNRADDMIPVA